MGRFTGKIVAEYNPPTKWILEKDLGYTADLSEEESKTLEQVGVKIKMNLIIVKKGFVTDLASTPRILWNLISPWDVARAAIIHDLLYKTIRQYRWSMKTHKNDGIIFRENKELVKIVADKVFLMGMKDAYPKIPSWKIYAAWKAVDLFGRWSIIPNEDNI